MDTDQNDICQFLKTWPDQFVSSREICRRAGGKWRFREDPHWALPVLRRMIESNLIETDDTGHYRLRQLETAEEKKNKQLKKLWISPALKRILQRSGRKFAVIDLDKELDPAEIAAGLGPSTGYQFDDANLKPGRANEVTGVNHPVG